MEKKLAKKIESAKQDIDSIFNELVNEINNLKKELELAYKKQEELEDEIENQSCIIQNISGG